MTSPERVIHKQNIKTPIHPHTPVSRYIHTQMRIFDMNMIMKQIWDRQAGESSKAYDAFTLYRDMGAGRSVAKVEKKYGNNKRLLERWCAKYGWVQRAAAYDDEQDQIRRQVAKDELIKSTREHLRNVRKLRSLAMKAIISKHPDNISFADAVRALELAVKMERQALGADDKTRTEVTVTATVEQKLSAEVMELTRRIVARDATL